MGRGRAGERGYWLEVRCSAGAEAISADPGPLFRRSPDKGRRLRMLAARMRASASARPCWAALASFSAAFGTFCGMACNEQAVFRSGSLLDKGNCAQTLHLSLAPHLAPFGLLATAGKG